MSFLKMSHFEIVSMEDTSLWFGSKEELVEVLILLSELQSGKHI